MQTEHIPVLLEEVLKFLQPRAGGHYVDGTLGGGGHAEAILEQSAPGGKVLGIDSDAQALARVERRLDRAVEDGRLVLVHGNFAELARIVDEAGFVSSVDGLLKTQNRPRDRKSTRLNSSHGYISYAVFCLKKKK